MRYSEILEACWKGYRRVGMKKKGDRMVPNCVPVSKEQMEEDLRKWFKEKWVRFGPDGKIRGACARGSESEGKPKCLPQAKAHALGKKGRAAAAAKKRREDPNPERRGPAKNVATRVRETVDRYELKITDQWEDEDPESYGTMDEYEFDVLKNGRSIGRARANNYFADLYVDLNNGKHLKLSHQKHQSHPLMKEYQRLVWGLDEQGVAEGKKDDSDMEIHQKNAERFGRNLGLPDRSSKKPNKETDMDQHRKNVARFGKNVKEQHDWDDADEFGMPGSEFFPEKQPRGHYKVYYMTATDHKLMGRYATRDEAEQRVRELKAEYPDNQFIVFASQRGMKEQQELDEKQDACYRKVKSRYKVWPSAYASGALVQCRKRGAANWGNKSKK